ncbi:hypothetical protein L9F63_001325, partial [Diploptera punctata]
MTTLKTLDVVTDIKYIHILSRFLGLAPYKITKNQLSEESSIDISIKNNTMLIMWSGMLAIFMLICIITTIMHCTYVYLLDESLSDNIHLILCMPMFPIVAFVSILMNVTINKRKMAEFITKISHIDNKINSLNIYDFSPNSFRYLHDLDILILIVLVPYLEFDILIWNNDKTISLYYRSITYGHILDIVVILQYCKCVRIIRKRLTELCRLVKKMDIPNVVIPQLRYLLTEICDTNSVLSSMYGPLILLELVRIFLVLIDLNTVIRHFNRGFFKLFSLVCWKMMIIVELVYIIVNCQLTVAKLRHLNHSVHNVLCLKHLLSAEVFQQVTFLLNQISTCSLEFTAFGIIKLDYSFLCSVFASIVTYGVLLLEF